MKKNGKGKMMRRQNKKEAKHETDVGKGALYLPMNKSENKNKREKEEKKEKGKEN